MSGTKTSSINYDRRGELILNIRSTKEDLLRNFKFLNNQIEELCSMIRKEAELIKNKALKILLDNYIHTLTAQTEELGIKEDALNNFSVRTNATIRELERDQQSFKDEYKFNKRIADELTAVGSRISDAVKIDNIISKLESDFGGVEGLIKDKGHLLQEWVSNEYHVMMNEGNLLKQRFDSFIMDIGSGKTDETSLSSINEIYMDVRNHINRISDIVTDCTVKDNKVKALKKEIERLRKEVGEQYVLTQDSILKNILDDYLSRLKIYETSIERKEYQGIDGGLAAIFHNLPLLKETDKINSNIESEINKIESIFKGHDGIFKKWVIKDYEGYLNVKGGIVAKLSEFKNELGSNIDTAKFESLLVQSRSLSDKVASSLSLAIEKDNLHQKRLYVIKSLREVCASLGFQEMEEPHYAEKDNPYSPVVQNFDTLNLGAITFTVALEGRLESSSCISVDNCDEEFSKFSDILKSQFGIETSLKRIEGGEPIKKYKTAKDLPKSEGKLSQGK